jgi:hypothetical protein
MLLWLGSGQPKRRHTASAGRFICTTSLSDREQQLTLNQTVAATLFDVCLLFVWRSTKREFSFRSLGPPRGQKSLGFDRAMVPRKFCEKILDPLHNQMDRLLSLRTNVDTRWRE